MLLKCRYLAQFSITELAKHGAVINQAQAHCPFMVHAARSLTTITAPTSQELKPAAQPSSTTDKAECCSVSTPTVQKKNFNELVDSSGPCEKNESINKQQTLIETENFDYESHFSETIEKKKKDGSYRNFKKVIRSAAKFPEIQVTHLTRL